MKNFGLENLTDKELLGQLLCLEVSGCKDRNEIISIIKENKPGAIYVNNFESKKIKEITEIANSVTKYPVLVVADVEHGPAGVFKDCDVDLPNPMAWGACDDESLVERAGELTGKIARKLGVHLSLSPVVDVNLNKNNPLVNIRCPSDSAKEVLKIGGAFARGMQKNGYLMATAKHFPGDGVDDRNQHFCTTVNSLSKEEWDKTFGLVYQGLIDEGVSAIMAAHIALPAYDEDNVDPVFGPLPSVLSYPLLTGLLKEKLGFRGCVISDAMSMVGSASRVKLRELAPKFIQAGGDIVLFPEKNDLNNLMAALQDGSLKRERVLEAVTAVLELKEKARLFEDQKKIEDEIDLAASVSELKEISMKIAEKSVKIVRDVNGILPLQLKKGDKVLIINLYKDAFKCTDDTNVQLFDFINALKERGIEADVYHRITHYKVKEIKDDYKAIIVNSKISSTDWRGGDLRIGWDDGIMIFWRAYILEHPNLVFISFGDPYKLYELPFLKTYMNAFSNTTTSQQAAVKLLLGEIGEKAKNPVSLKGFFERETD